MFSYEEIQKYNKTDIRIYKYIVSAIDKIQYMTTRELAKKLQVSTSTERFAGTFGFFYKGKFECL